MLRLIIVIPLTIALLPSAGIALEGSLACLFQIMTGVGQLMTLCGEPLDRSTEVKYQELRAALKKYINENALRDDHKIGPDYDEKSLERGRDDTVSDGAADSMRETDRQRPTGTLSGQGERWLGPTVVYTRVTGRRFEGLWKA
jgi:hypothetical protein